MKQILFIIFLTFTAYPIAAQNGTSGMDFLNIGPSARLLSISEAGTSTLTGPSAIYTNPSLLAFEPQSSLDVNYTLWISGVTNQFAAVNFKRENRSLAFGVYNSRADDFEARNQPGPSQGSFSISYLSLSAAGAYRIGPVSAGITAQYLREEVFELRANGYAINAGTSAEFLDGRIRAGLAVRNLGEMEELDVESTRLPALISAGLTAELIEFTTPGVNDLPVLFSLTSSYLKPLEEFSNGDYTDSNSDDGFLSFGLILNADDLIFLQGGYQFGSTERPVSFGLGLEIEPVRINYAVVPFSTGFGVVHAIGLEFYF